MKNNNLKLGIITATVFLTSVIGALTIIAWMSSLIEHGDFFTYFFSRYLNAGYVGGIILGLIIAFLCGYSYNTILSNNIKKYLHIEQDMPIEFVKRICRAKLLSQYFGYSAVVSFLSTALLCAFTGYAYIEGFCILMSLGFISLIFWSFYRLQPREIMRERFKII